MDRVSEETDLAHANAHIKVATVRLLAQADCLRRLECSGNECEEASRLLGTMWDSLIAMHLHRRVIRQALGLSSFADHVDDRFAGRRTHQVERLIERTLVRTLRVSGKRSPTLECTTSVRPFGDDRERQH
jgi:hypothetical protein